MVLPNSFWDICEGIGDVPTGPDLIVGVGSIGPLFCPVADSRRHHEQRRLRGDNLPPLIAKAPDVVDSLGPDSGIDGRPNGPSP
jgi:hypothetical protein